MRAKLVQPSRIGANSDSLETELGFLGVKEGIYDHLRLQIIVGNLHGGQKLNEMELASRFNSSRAPIRETFRMLESENLVTSIPRKGCHVSRLSLQNCKEICEAREMIECFAIDLLERKGITELPEVASTIKVADKLSLPSSDDARERYQYLKASLDFHTKLVQSAGSSCLFQFYRSIFTNLARYRSTYHPTIPRASRSRKEHEHIIKLIGRQHYSQAKDSLRSHLNWAFEEITKAMSEKAE